MIHDTTEWIRRSISLKDINGAVMVINSADLNALEKLLGFIFLQLLKYGIISRIYQWVYLLSWTCQMQNLFLKVTFFSKIWPLKNMLPRNKLNDNVHFSQITSSNRWSPCSCCFVSSKWSTWDTWHQCKQKPTWNSTRCTPRPRPLWTSSRLVPVLW